MKFQVKIGNDFVVDAFSVNDEKIIEAAADAQARLEIAKTRRNITLGVMAFVIMALICATYIGVRDGSYDEVSSVWDAAKFPTGFILATYFMGSGNQ